MKRRFPVYAVKDTNGDQIADKRWVMESQMNNPNSVALKNGNLFVAETRKVTNFPTPKNLASR